MKIEVIQEQEKLVLNIKGRLDTITAPQLESILSEHKTGQTEIVLDLKELEYISSAGLCVLLNTHKEMTKQGRKLIIRNVNDTVQEAFDITGFSGKLNIE